MKTNTPTSPSQPPLSNVDNQETQEKIDEAMKELHKGNYTTALNLVKDTLTRQPSCPAAHNALSSIHMTIGDSMHKLLIESSNTAIKIFPGSFPFSITHAKVLCRLARYNEALETCNSALSIPTGISDDAKKELRVLKGKIMKSQDAMNLAMVKHEIQELQEQKEQIQERAITRRKKNEILRPHSSYNTAQLKNYWRTMTMDLKKQFLKIQMADLKSHFDHDRLATHALEGLKEIKIWKVWHCWCNSHSMFYSENLMMQHILNEHLCTSQNFFRGNNSTELESFYKICKSTEKWRPVDVAAAVKIMQNLSRNEQGDQGQYSSKVFMNQDEWPYCNDSKREEIINKIQERLREFLNIGWFDSRQFSVFMDLIMEMLKKQIPELLLKEYRMNCTLLWVCFLDISGLNLVFVFLDDLYNICGLQSLFNSHVKDEVRGDPCVANFEKITFNEDFSWVAFDNRMLRGELFVPNDGFAFRFSADDEIELSDDECKNAIVDWLLSGDTSIEQELKQYTSFALYSKIQAKELFNICKAEFQRMQNIRAIKSKYLRELEHWKYLEYQLKDIEVFPYLDSRPSPFKSFLLERQKEINADTFESDMIFDILSEEQEQDNKIILVIRNQIDEMTEKIYKFDCIIRTTIIAMKQTMKKIAMVTVYDYRSIMVPLLKSYMRARLEDHINAEKKSKKVPVLYCGHNLIDFYQETKRLAELTGTNFLRNEAEDVPFSGYNFGTVNWIDFYRAQHVRCDEESSEPEQKKGPKAPESD